jgi:hypothetical protein
LQYIGVEPSAPGRVRLTVGLLVHHPSVASPAKGMAVIQSRAAAAPVIPAAQ